MRSPASARTFFLFALPAAATMLIGVRVAFGDWHLNAQVMAFAAMLAVFTVSKAARSRGKNLGPEGAALMALTGNMMRAGAMIIAVVLVYKLRYELFPPFCASTMVGYMYYLIAEIYELHRNPPT